MPPEFAVSNTFELGGQVVLGGTVLKGVIKEKQILLLGPDKQGSFYPVEIQEVQCNRVKVKSAQCGQTCTAAVKRVFTKATIGTDSDPIRQGMVLVDSRTNPKAYWEFQAELWVFDEDSASSTR